jgi:hypothetical protein
MRLQRRKPPDLRRVSTRRGWAFPAALGASFAAPGRRSYAAWRRRFSDDVAGALNEEQYDTRRGCARNQRCWMAIADLLRGMWATFMRLATALSKAKEPYSPDFAEIAKNFGIAE